MTTTPVLTAGDVDMRRAEALGRLAMATGDASLCAVSRSGRPAPAAKYHEGAVAALTDVLRHLAESVEPAEAAVDHVRERWSARRDAATALTANWQAYLDGGLDTLADLGQPTPAPSATPTTGAARFRTVPTVIELGADPAEPAEPGSGHGVLSGWRSRVPWSRRRTVTVAVLSPLLLVLLLTEGGGWDPQGAPVWTALVAAAAVVSAAIIATYLPGQTTCRASQGGLTPCAVVPVGTLLAAGWLLGAEPHAVPSALGALGVVTFGLVQRLSGTSCAP